VKATALVVTWNARPLLGSLLETLGGLHDAGVPAVVVDNASSDGTADALGSIPWIRLLRNPWNAGFGGGNNAGLGLVETPFVLLLNSDAHISPADLAALSSFLDANHAFAGVQPLVRAWDWPEVTAGRGIGYNSFLEGFDLGFMRFEPHPAVTEPVEVQGVGAAVSLMRTSALMDCGGFDERLFMYFEDAELAIRMKSSGWRFAVLPRVGALHRVGFSSTRARAGSWEIASSLMIARKYGASMLPERLAREARIWGAGLLSGRPPMWRLPGLVRGLATPMERIRGCPLPPVSPIPDEPPPRSAPQFPLCASGTLRTGPGWRLSRGRASFTGFGALAAAHSGTLKAVLKASMGTHSCRVWNADAPGTPFILSGRETLIEAPVGQGRVYIAADDRDGMPVVELLDVVLERSSS
jgi:N-acetylglucosaminyl-diphospho-decaprenol L-rhamnosyltransferase